LLSAYAISPDQGSEPGVGWNVAIRLAKYHDVTVLCGDLGGGRQTESALLDYFSIKGPIQGLDVCYVPPSAVVRAIHWLHARPGLWFLYYSAYKIWQRDAFAQAVELHAHKQFDLVHQLTIASFREPGYLWRLPVPFFWGPIGGATSPPLKMLRTGGLRFLVRHLGNAIQRRFLRRSSMACRKASVTWVVAEEDRRLIEQWGGRVEEQCQVGTSNISDVPRTRKEDEALRVVWSGLHITRKALPLALETLIRIADKRQVHLDILGTGPLTLRCQAMSRHLQIEHLITWHGRLSQKDALAVMSNAHVLLHTSISEGTPQVIMEALALGLPVVCHDACGMRAAITNECGIKVPLIDPETSIHGFCLAIEEMADPLVYNRLSAGSLQRAHELTWDSKVARISEAYKRVCV